MKNKKLNELGFTLIELLAVITILGILMLAAIPAITRTIENSRRDTFADNVRTYINTVRNAVLADELKCTGYDTVSAVPDGTYYYSIDTTADGTKDLMESLAKSSWGSAELLGYISWTKSGEKSTYKAYITDTNKHGMSAEKSEDDVSRSAISANTTSLTSTTAVPSGAVKCELK